MFISVKKECQDVKKREKNDKKRQNVKGIKYSDEQQ